MPPAFRPLVLVLPLLWAGCAGDEIPDSPLGTPQPPSTRPPDGLLSDPGLQEIVDQQVERDGEALRRFLTHSEARMRARAAFALASVQDPGSVDDLARLLRDDDADVRRDAAFALGQLPAQGQDAALLRALEREEDSSARRRILEAVGKVGEEGALTALLRAGVEGDEEGELTMAVARLGIRGVTLPTSLDHLVRALRHPDSLARMNAAYYFGRTADPAPWASRADEVRAVLDSLSPADPRAMHLLNGLAKLGEAEDTPRLVWWLRNSPDWRVRSNAAAGMAGRTGSGLVRTRLMAALDDPVTHVAVNAATVLSATRRIPPAEVAELKSWIEAHPEEWRRAGPVLALLGRMGDGEFLRSWLQSWEPTRVGPRTRGLGALAFVPGEDATRILVDALESEYPRIRGTAMGGLARRWRVEREDTAKHRQYFDLFARGLRMGDPGTVYVAAPALADSLFLPLGSVDLLMSEFETMELPEDLEGMQAILRALGETDTPRARDFLEEVLGHTETALREVAANVLSDLRGEEVDAGTGPSEAERTVDWTALRELGARPRLILETEKGEVRLILDASSAPLTVQTVAGFASAGRYDGVPFHRVVPNFVVQGGDFAREDGFGGPGFSIRSEFTEIPFRRGVVGMASAGKDTEGSQFFITHSRQPHLEGSYTAFGWVEAGMDGVDRIYEEDRIVRARVEPDPGADTG